MHALNELCIAAATKGTQEALEYFLNYCVTHQEAEIIYRASEIILNTVMQPTKWQRNQEAEHSD